MLGFGHFELQPERRRLLQDGHPVVIGARAFDVLLALTERRDRVVTKAELLDFAWPNLIVEENNLQVQVSALRKLLGPDAIATIPGRGYRFTAKLNHIEEVPEPRRTAAGPLVVDLKGNLPAASMALVGREKELQTTQALLRRHRLLTLHGPGGIGKSSLALALGQALRHEFSDGAWLVELAPLTDPNDVATEVARTLGLMLPGNDKPAPELALALRMSCLLLVLDNCEHVAAASRELVRAILAQATKVSVIVTSQEVLHLAGREQVFRLETLFVPESTSQSHGEVGAAALLFLARATTAEPRLTVEPLGPRCRGRNMSSP